MTPTDAARVVAEARRQIEQETFDAAVAAEKQRLRAHRNLWQRLVDKLPFTITIRRKTP